MAEDERLFSQIVGGFKYREPTEEELLQDLVKLTGKQKEDDKPEPSTESLGGESGLEAAMPDFKEENPEILQQLAKLSLGNESVEVDRQMVTKDSKREELKRLAIQAKREGRLEEAKEYLLRYKSFGQEMDSSLVEGKVEQVRELAKRSSKSPNPDAVNGLKKKALQLKRAGDIGGALSLMRQANEMADPQLAMKQQYKRLFDRLQQQVKWCLDAAKYYERTKQQKAASLFSKRKRATEKELQSLLADFKTGKGVPDCKEKMITFETQELDERVKEKDMQVAVNLSKLALRDRADYKLRVTFECPPMVTFQEQERTVKIEPGKNEYIIWYEDRITRDIRQQKFFEHRRLKFDLIFKERSLLFFSSESVVASGGIKLTPLCTGCSLSGEVRLIDADQRKHSCSISVGIAIRHPITTKEPIKRKEYFIYIPQYNVHVDCEYGELTMKPAETIDYFVSYVVLEQEMERLTRDQSSEAQLKLIELEGRRDRLQLQVQTGQLTMEQYLLNVRQCLAATKKSCMEYKRAEDLNQAKRLLQYIKLMEEEIAEAECNPENE